MLDRKRDVIPNRKKNVSTRGKSLRVSIPNKGKQKKTKIDSSGAWKKVYCRSCVELIAATRSYQCHADSNKMIKPNEQEWLTPDTGFSLREHPSQKNRGNRCPDWIEKIG